MRNRSWFRWTNLEKHGEHDEQDELRLNWYLKKFNWSPALIPINGTIRFKIQMIKRFTRKHKVNKILLSLMSQ